MADFSSAIFHRLRQNPRLGTSYFFFNHSNRDQTAENVIRFLLRHAVAQLPTIPADVHAEYSRFKTDPHKIMANGKRFAGLLKSSLEEFANFSASPSFVLLDAYDEFCNSKSEDRERADLLFCLSEIFRTNKVKILISTRPHWCMELANTFKGCQVAEVKGDLKDVKQYLEHELEFRNLSDGTKDLIKTAIVEANKEEPWSSPKLHS